MVSVNSARFLNDSPHSPTFERCIRCYFYGIWWVSIICGEICTGVTFTRCDDLRFYGITRGDTNHYIHQKYSSCAKHPEHCLRHLQRFLPYMFVTIYEVHTLALRDNSSLLPNPITSCRLLCLVSVRESVSSSISTKWLLNGFYAFWISCHVNSHIVHMF